MATQSAKWIATARLLRRTGFGTIGPTVDAVAGQDWSLYLDRVLGLDAGADSGAIATPMPTYPEAPTYPGKDAPRDAKDAWNKTVDGQMMQLTQWWLQRMNAVHEPIHEKLTLLWHNHFATSALKVRFATYMAAQNQKLRTMKLGEFRPLAYAMLTDAAMLSWLDGTDNVGGSPNENLSREFMELFSLGHGRGYAEADVKEGARALTGWASNPEGISMMQVAKHDIGAKTVLSVTGNLDASSFCDAVLAHPNSPSYVATRLWRQLASDAPPSPETLSRLVDAYGTNGDLKALTKATLLDPEFAGGTSTTMPVEWLVGMTRTLGLSLSAKEFAWLLAYSPYDNPPEGYRPPLLVTGSVNDPRVLVHEPAKWVARLRATAPAADVLLKTEMGAGHGGPSGRYDAWKEEAFVTAWILDRVAAL